MRFAVRLRLDRARIWGTYTGDAPSTILTRQWVHHLHQAAFCREEAMRSNGVQRRRWAAKGRYAVALACLVRLRQTALLEVDHARS